MSRTRYKCTIIHTTEFPTFCSSFNHWMIDIYCKKVKCFQLSLLLFQQFLFIFRIHEKKRPYKCTTCEKKFVTWSNWTRHLAIHMGCKKFAKKVQKAVPVQKLRFIHRNGRKLVCKYDDARVRLVLKKHSVNGLFDKFLPFYAWRIFFCNIYLFCFVEFKSKLCTSFRALF